MFYGLQTGQVTVTGPEPCELAFVHADIESLNRRAEQADLDMTALSAGAYPTVAGTYRLVACGASMGVNYGPVVVARAPLDPATLRGAPVAIPGERTTAYLVARLFLPPFQPVALRFDAVMDAVRSGAVQAAVVIHEGQLTYADRGLAKVLDLGERWHAATGLPLPLGLNAVRRDLPDAWQRALTAAVRASIAYAETHAREALDFARSFAPGLDAVRARAFTRMYVNDLTRDMGPLGVRALETLYARAHAAGLLPTRPPVDVLMA
ncbi:MAG: ABC transporter substrate-binding protein [Actinobacteria bacterium]|nr:ABC transporter substrate-binding protein [Actinomycetota bacterium]